MLQKGEIPQNEPNIRVGIVMPEDGFTQIEFELRDKPVYQFGSASNSLKGFFANARNDKSGIGLLKSGSSYAVHLENKLLHLYKDGKLLLSAPMIQIQPTETNLAIAPQSGLRLKGVISGRDFHWKKRIDVTLAGALEFSSFDGQLIVINELPIERYLMCVATSEMGAACPDALIEAQTIAARSWMLANAEQKHIHMGMDVCNDDCCQRYQGTTFLTEQSIKGALQTYGQTLLYGNKICDARYSKSCGGVMEAFSTIWEDPDLPYLQVIADAKTELPEWKKPLSEENNFRQWVHSVPHSFCSPHFIPEEDLIRYLGSVDEESRYFRWEESVSQNELTVHLNRLYDLKAKAVKRLLVLQRGGSGRIIRLRLELIGPDGEELQLDLHKDFMIRQSLHPKFLYSSAFIVEIEPQGADLPEGFRFRGAGWGHGVGLCQIGALGMALAGYSAEEIVAHYFPGSKLTKLYG